MDQDTPSLIRYPAHAGPPPHLSVYRFATALSSPILASLGTYWLITHGCQKELVVATNVLPNLTLLLVVALAFLIPQRWLYPRQVWPAAGRTRLLNTLRRISIGGLARTEDGKFGDVLLADALTSYARIFSDIYIAVYMMLTRRSTTGPLDRSSIWTVPIIMAFPFLIRFRQCIADNQPFNALKYATAFPAIAFSVMLRLQRGTPAEGNTAVIWFVALLVNALYSFWWDVTKDWGLTLFTTKRVSPECKSLASLTALQQRDYKLSATEMRQRRFGLRNSTLSLHGSSHARSQKRTSSYLSSNGDCYDPFPCETLFTTWQTSLIHATTIRHTRSYADCREQTPTVFVVPSCSATRPITTASSSSISCSD